MKHALAAALVIFITVLLILAYTRTKEPMIDDAIARFVTGRRRDAITR